MFTFRKALLALAVVGGTAGVGLGAATAVSSAATTSTTTPGTSTTAPSTTTHPPCPNGSASSSSTAG